MRHAPTGTGGELESGAGCYDGDDGGGLVHRGGTEEGLFAEDAPTSAGLNTVRTGAVHIVVTD